MKPKKQRIGKTALRKGSKRPEVYLLQEALYAAGYVSVGAADGDFGPKTEAAVADFQRKSGLQEDAVVGGGTWSFLLPLAYEKGFSPSLERRIHALICQFEVGNSRNAYGMAEPDIGDKAGANYGVLQHNRHGSLVTVLKMAGRQDLVDLYNGTDKTYPQPQIVDFMGSSAGRHAQNVYYDKVVVKAAMGYLDDIPTFVAWKNDPLLHRYYERAVTMMIDTVTQNGGFWSSKRRPFWRSITPAEEKTEKYSELYHGSWWDELTGGYCDYFLLKELFMKAEKSLGGDLRKANVKVCNQVIKMMPTAELQLVVAAQWRARCSWSKYWRTVASRRMLDATGEGLVYGSPFNLADEYALGRDTVDFEDDGEHMESFRKDPDKDPLTEMGLND